MRFVILLQCCFFIVHLTMAQGTMKMLRANCQPMIKGQLNGKKAYFLVDTGSDVTILNSKDAKKYKFLFKNVRPGTYKLSGLNSEHSEIGITPQVDLLLGTKKIKLSCKVLDLSHISRAIHKDTGIMINGIIGSDLMRKHKFLIDYQAKEIRFDDG